MLWGCSRPCTKQIVKKWSPPQAGQPEKNPKLSKAPPGVREAVSREVFLLLSLGSSRAGSLLAVSMSVSICVYLCDRQNMTLDLLGFGPVGGMSATDWKQIWHTYQSDQIIFRPHFADFNLGGGGVVLTSSIKARNCRRSECTG